MFLSSEGGLLQNVKEPYNPLTIFCEIRGSF